MTTSLELTNSKIHSKRRRKQEYAASFINEIDDTKHEVHDQLLSQVDLVHLANIIAIAAYQCQS